MSTKSPCRLFVVFARDADVGVILRRGPSKWVQVIKWNTRRDTFEDGAWFHGRIYEHSCDVSPDGRLFVYLAAKQHRPRSDGHLYTWTAVSRPPWLHALALWSHPYGVYGGGRFDSNSHLTLWSSFWGELYAVPGHPSLHGLMVEQENYETPKASPVEIAGASWAGRDQRNFIIFARDGKLFRRDWTDHELIDFNDRQPAPQRAPDWAKTWTHKNK